MLKDVEIWFHIFCARFSIKYNPMIPRNIYRVKYQISNMVWRKSSVDWSPNKFANLNCIDWGKFLIIIRIPLQQEKLKSWAYFACKLLEHMSSKTSLMHAIPMVFLPVLRLIYWNQLSKFARERLRKLVKT